jgi:hypothetical protein
MAEHATARENRHGRTPHGTRKVTVHLDARRQEKFEDLTRLLSPLRPEAVPLTEVLLYCIDEMWEAKCRARKGTH